MTSSSSWPPPSVLSTVILLALLKKQKISLALLASWALARAFPSLKRIQILVMKISQKWPLLLDSNPARPTELPLRWRWVDWFGTSSFPGVANAKALQIKSKTGKIKAWIVEPLEEREGGGFQKRRNDVGNGSKKENSQIGKIKAWIVEPLEGSGGGDLQKRRNDVGDGSKKENLRIESKTGWTVEPSEGGGGQERRNDLGDGSKKENFEGKKFSKSGKEDEGVTKSGWREIVLGTKWSRRENRVGESLNDATPGEWEGTSEGTVKKNQEDPKVLNRNDGAMSKNQESYMVGNESEGTQSSSSHKNDYRNETSLPSSPKFTTPLPPSSAPLKRKKGVVIHFKSLFGNRGQRSRVKLYEKLSHDPLFGLHTVCFDSVGENEEDVSERTMLVDSYAVWSTVTKSQEFSPESVIIWGSGLGSCAAANLCLYLMREGTPPAALVLENPPRSFPKLISSHFEFAGERVQAYVEEIAKTHLLHRFDLEKRIMSICSLGLKVPILLLSCTKNYQVPPAHAEHLASLGAASAASHRVVLQTFPTSPLDVLNHEGFNRIVSKFINQALADARGSSILLRGGGGLAVRNRLLSTDFGSPYTFSADKVEAQDRLFDEHSRGSNPVVL